MKPDLMTAYSNQRGRAKNRGIDWEFTFDTWLSWWESTGKLSQRGRHVGGYIMCRVNDTGPYSPSNAYCGTYSDNMKDMLSLGTRKGWQMSDDHRARIAKLAGKAGGKRFAELYSLSQDTIKIRLSLISDIDLTKFGWVGKVAKVLNISHTHARRFVDEWYDGEVYKRNTPVAKR